MADTPIPTYAISTEILDDGVIEQGIKSDPRDEYLYKITRIIIDTKEEHVRKALISLGWTPPQVNSTVNDFLAFAGCCNRCSRKTGEESLDTICNMTQPTGLSCMGKIVPMKENSNG